MYSSRELKDSVTLFAVHYDKIRIHMCETATNSAKIHSVTRKVNICS